MNIELRHPLPSDPAGPVDDRARRGRRSPIFLLTSAVAAIAGLLAVFTLVTDLHAVSAALGFAGAAAIAAVVALARGRATGQAMPAVPAGAIEQDAGNWHKLVSALPDAALVLDGTDALVAFNDKARELLRNLRPGLRISGAIRNPEFLGAIESVRATGEPQRVRYSERVPIERRIEAHIAAIRLGSATGAEAPMVVSFRDLTEQQRLDELRADFIANASHELRTPLATLLSFIETLQGPAREDPDARQRFLGVMANQAQRMTRLIDDLMSLSRVEMHEHVRPLDPVDINQVASNVLDMFELVAKDAGINLSLQPQPGQAIVYGDRDELVQVIQNLVQNALKYGKSGGNVAVRVHRMPEQGRIAVDVEDDGPGIAPDHLPRLTERFYRADIPTSRAKGGTGLGLAIVKHAVNRHQGELRISSQLGKGSLFSVVLQEYDNPGS